MELEELFDLIEAGGLGTVQAALAENPDLLNQQEGREGGRGRSALYVAIKSGQEGIAQFLISQKGIDLSLRFNCTVIGNNSDGSILYRVGETILIHAASCGMINTVACLIEKKPGGVKQAAADTGSTSLWAASENGHAEVVRLLLERGAEVNQAAQNGTTPLWVASWGGHLEVARLLLTSGAGVNQARTDVGETPLYMASENGHAEVAELLLEGGAAVNQASTDDGTTPLWVASYFNHVAVAQLLLEAKAEVNQARTTDGETPLLIASKNGYLEVVKLLLERGAAVNQTAQNGATPLWVASWAGHLEVVKLLVIVGADASNVLAGLNPGSIPINNLNKAAAEVEVLGGTIDFLVASVISGGLVAGGGQGVTGFVIDVFIAMRLVALVACKKRSEASPARIFHGGQIDSGSFWRFLLGRVAVKVGVNAIEPTVSLRRLALKRLEVILLIVFRLSLSEEKHFPAEMWSKIMGFCADSGIFKLLIACGDKNVAGVNNIASFLNFNVGVTQEAIQDGSDQAEVRLAEGSDPDDEKGVGVLAGSAGGM